MKTILIAHNYDKNSFANLSYQLAHSLASKGDRVIFMSHKPYIKEVFEKKIGKGILIVSSWSSKNRPTGFKDVVWFYNIYKQYKPSIIIGHFVGSNITTLVSKILSFNKAKTFIYYHTLSKQINTDSNTKIIKNKINYYRKRFFYYFFCDKLICPSNLAKIDLLNYFKINKGVVVLNPMEDRFVDNLMNSNTNNIISYLGRLDSSKGVIDMIEAFKIYKKKNINSKLILQIAGSGKYEKTIKMQVNNFEDIKFLGNLDYKEVDNYIKNSSFIIIPSKIDNLPTVGLEALMNSTPILLSSKTGLSEYLKDNENCYLFLPEIEKILELFKKVEDNFIEYTYLRKNARQSYLDNFSMDKYITKMEEIIK